MYLFALKRFSENSYEFQLCDHPSPPTWRQSIAAIELKKFGESFGSINKQ